MYEELYTDATPMNSYSINLLIKTIFEYELRNYLLIIEEKRDNSTEVVISYLQQRIKDITENYS